MLIGLRFNNPTIEEFEHETGVIPAKAGHEVKLLRYPGSNGPKALDARLHGMTKKLPDC